MRKKIPRLPVSYGLVFVCCAVVVGLFSDHAHAQRTLIGPRFTVVTVSTALSPADAGTLADHEIQRLAANGWEPINVAADYKSDEREGTTVQTPNSRLWVVYILLKCNATIAGNCKK